MKVQLHFAEYTPVRNYHARRVRRLQGNNFIERVKFLYEHNGEFRINMDFIVGILFSFIAAISIVTILLLSV